MLTFVIFEFEQKNWNFSIVFVKRIILWKVKRDNIFVKFTIQIIYLSTIIVSSARTLYTNIDRCVVMWCYEWVMEKISTPPTVQALNKISKNIY